MKKSGVLMGIAAVVVAGILGITMSGSTVRAAGEGDIVKKDGVEYKIEKLPDGDKLGEVIVVGACDKKAYIYNEVDTGEGKYKCIGLSKGAFHNEKDLQYVAISGACEFKTIPDDSFNGCSNLKRVDINTSKVTTIGKYAFKNCKKLEKIKIASDKMKKSNFRKNSFAGVGDLLVLAPSNRMAEKYAKWIEGKGGADSAEGKRY